jgi:hypothetical protein
MINTFDKVTRYKTNIKKSVAFYIPTVNRLKKKSGKQSHSQ